MFRQLFVAVLRCKSHYSFRQVHSMAGVDVDADNGKRWGKQSILFLEQRGIARGDLNKLKEAGYNSVETVAYSTRKELMAVKGISEQTAEKLQMEAYKLCPMGFTGAAQEEYFRIHTRRIKTGSQALDQLLGGGIETRSITEIFGESDSGKSQICHSLAVKCQLPDQYGDAGGKCMWIDTNNSFRPEVIVATAKRFGINPTSALANVTVLRCNNSEHQIKLCDAAVAMMSESRYALLIVDSATTHFRHEYSGHGTAVKRQLAIGRFMYRLKERAKQFGVAVVITNQMDASEKSIVDCHVTTRLGLRAGTDGSRVCKVHQTPHQPEDEASFYITSAGIGDARESTVYFVHTV